MKILLFSLLALGVYSSAAHGAPVRDELARTIAACGKPARDEQASRKLMGPKVKARYLTYNGIQLDFVAGTNDPKGYEYIRAERGPDLIDDSTVLRDLPCFGQVKAATFVPTVTPPETKSTSSGGGEPVVLLIIIALFYFLPSVVAWYRGVASTGGIQSLNILLGWTILGWILALIWAAGAETKTQAKAKELDYEKLAAAMTARDRKPGT